jgi:hypothetical protein
MKDVHLHLVPVYAKGIGTATIGNAAPGTIVAQAATIVVNGVPQTSYLYSNGGQTWKTPYAPWDPNLPVTHNKDGSITIDASALKATGPRAVALAKGNPDFYAITIAGLGRVDPTTIVQNPDGTIASVTDPKTGNTVAVGPGQLAQTLVTNVPGALYATDPTRAAGPSPTEDFKTWTQAMLVATPGGQQEYDKLSQDKGFQQRLASEIAVNTADPVTGAPNANVQAAANLQAFGGQTMPGLDAPFLGNMFNWLINRPATDTAANSTPASVVNQGSPQPLYPVANPLNPSSSPGLPPEYAQPETPSLRNLGSTSNDYLSLVRMGIAPKPPFIPASALNAQQPVRIAPADIKVPQPPAPTPVRTPFGVITPGAPLYNIKPPPPPPIYGSGGGGGRRPQ